MKKIRILSALSSLNPPVTIGQGGKQDKQYKEQKYQLSNKCRTNKQQLTPQNGNASYSGL